MSLELYAAYVAACVVIIMVPWRIEDAMISVTVGPGTMMMTMQAAR